jgi:transcriptional regulatory protein GAL4
VLLAVDPALQMLFENTLWDKDIFEGLNGFPSTGVGEAFDYIPSNNYQNWLRSYDSAGHYPSFTQ